jgi:hypothetical protein
MTIILTTTRLEPETTGGANPLVVVWLLLRLKQPQQNKCLVKVKTQFIFGGAQYISRLKCRFYQSSFWLLFFFTVYFFK